MPEACGAGLLVGLRGETRRGTGPSSVGRSQGDPLVRLLGLPGRWIVEFFVWVDENGSCPYRTDTPRTRGVKGVPVSFESTLPHLLPPSTHSRACVLWGVEKSKVYPEVGRCLLPTFPNRGVKGGVLDTCRETTEYLFRGWGSDPLFLYLNLSGLSCLVAAVRV